MAKVASSVARPRKCYLNRLERFIWRHIRKPSTNQIAGNSLFSSEIILITVIIWLSHKDWKVANSQILLAQIDIDRSLDFPIYAGI